MKTKISVIIFMISTFLVSCVPSTVTQEAQGEAVELAAQEVFTAVPLGQESDETQTPVVVDTPTFVFVETPMACVALIAPFTGAEIPPIGKFTFSWTPMDNAGDYILNIIPPSGTILSFETEQTFSERYMEVFTAGGEYQWQVTARDPNGNTICASEMGTFTKPVLEQQNEGAKEEEGGGTTVNPCEPWPWCDGGSGNE